MEDILFRFYELMERLEADPSVTVLGAETYRGASEADFDDGRSCFDPLILGDAAFWKEELRNSGALGWR